MAGVLQGYQSRDTTHELTETITRLMGEAFTNIPTTEEMAEDTTPPTVSESPTVVSDVQISDDITELYFTQQNDQGTESMADILHAYGLESEQEPPQQPLDREHPDHPDIEE